MVCIIWFNFSPSVLIEFSISGRQMSAQEERKERKSEARHREEK
jgi:hypothetical protein